MKSFRIQIAFLCVAYLGLLAAAGFGAASAGSSWGDDMARFRLRAANAQMTEELRQRREDDVRVQEEIRRVEKLNKVLTARVKTLEAERAVAPLRPFGWTPPTSIGAPPP